MNLKLKEKDIQWITGFYEGEGTCGVYGKKYKRFHLAIHQKEEKVLRHIQEVVGFGGICHYRVGEVGECFMWHISSKNAFTFLKAIFPYIRSDYKKEQATKALKRWEQYQHSKILAHKKGRQKKKMVQ